MILISLYNLCKAKKKNSKAELRIKNSIKNSNNKE